MTTQRRIAETCGLSQAAVSMALRRHPAMHAQTIERVLRAARKLGYDTERHVEARRLAARRHGQAVVYRQVAALLVPDFHRAPYHTRLLAGLVDELGRRGFGITIILSDREDAEAAAVLPPAVARGDIDGLVIFPAGVDRSPLVRHLREGTRFGDAPVIR